MPQCMCGSFFSTTSYNVDRKENDICPRCRDASTPKSYTSTYQWDCENVTGILIDMSGSQGGFNFE